jgi:basic amino acid/polyamine antiporter, APA family
VQAARTGLNDHDRPVPDTRATAPQPVLRVVDAVALIVGIVVGAGIFSAPAQVAANAGSAMGVIAAWLMGGLISLIGAMCYAELASAYPNPGGDYHYLRLAFGKTVSFLFAWARLTVIPTGSIALLAFVFGDYASQVFSLGERSSAVYAALLVVFLTGLNIAGLQQGKWAQNLLTLAEVAGVALVMVAGLLISNDCADTQRASASLSTSWGLVLIFVMLTYGGWNEAAYISAELRGAKHTIARALLFSLSLVMALYVLINLAYLNALGLGGMSQSEAVAADVMRRATGETGAVLVSTFIAIATITSANATILLGARMTYAFGTDYPLFSALGRWRGSAPVNALLVQGGITLCLVFLGSVTRTGFETMVEYTAPVFWFFFLLTGISLFVLRVRKPDVPRPFRAPFYPLTPIVFCLTSAYLLYASIMHTGIGALVGIAVLLAGIPALLLTRLHS